MDGTVWCLATDQFSLLHDLLQLEEKEDPHMLVRQEVTGEGKLLRLFWSAGAARLLDRAYHHALTIDATFKTNRYTEATGASHCLFRFPCR